MHKLQIDSNSENSIFSCNNDRRVGRLSPDEFAVVVQGDDALLGDVPHIFAALPVAELTLGRYGSRLAVHVDVPGRK